MGKSKKPKRKPSPYNKHVGREMKAGKTMKQAAASWDKKRSKPKTKSASKPRNTSRSSSNTGGRKLGKNSFNTAKIFSLLTKAALIAPAAAIAMGDATPENKIREGLYAYTGYHMGTGQVDLGHAFNTYKPYLFTKVVQAVVPKIASFIRSVF